MADSMKENAVKVEENTVKTEENGGKKVKNKEISFVIKVKNNPNFCGVGAGGVQFAKGEAVIKSSRMARWFEEHEGYEVTRK